jgi:hypothetical protein
MYGDSGFDRYLEFQYQFTGDFYTMLFRAIGQADDRNLDRLAKGFPEEVEAHVTWTLGRRPVRPGRDEGPPATAPDAGSRRNPAVRLAMGDKLPEGYKIDRGDRIAFPARRQRRPGDARSTQDVTGLCPECGGSISVRLVSTTGWPTGARASANSFHQPIDEERQRLRRGRSCGSGRSSAVNPGDVVLAHNVNRIIGQDDNGSRR